MSRVIKSPPPLSIVANNWFHDGWLHGVLGLPKRTWDNPDDLVRDADIEAWEEGYDMARETGVVPISVFEKMLRLGQLTVREVLK